MKPLLILCFVCWGFIVNSQCPTGNTSKNGQCMIMTYPSVAEAVAAVNATVTISVAGSTSGANGSWTNAALCSGGPGVVFALNGANCNCNGAFGQNENGTFTFSTGDVCVYNADGTLPVKFSQISIEKDDGAIIKWTTSSEVNNDYFVVERSADGFNYNELGIIAGSGTTSSVSFYSYLDPFPLDGLSYYRLAQYDLDGSSYLSEVLIFRNSYGSDVITHEMGSDQLLITNLNFSAKFLLSNSNGQMVAQGNLTEGDNSISTSTLPQGLYFVSLLGKEKTTHKVFITHK